jgi:dihydrodipicolinate synthase/N-acetylneuraminate lyase
MDRVNIENLIGRLRPRRRVEGIAAALLPFEWDGRVAVEDFQRNLRATREVGLTNAVNMDTGYVNLLGESEKRDVLRWTREALGAGVPFVAGAYIEGLDGDPVSLYRRQMDAIAEAGGTPILFQTARMHALSAREQVSLFREVCRGFPEVLGFELSPVFAPSGEVFDDEMVRGLLDIPEMKGMKHSSLDRTTELRRLALRDEARPEFRIYTGNDLGINMIEYGSDYLLGLAAFAPAKFAERDRLWEEGDVNYYALSDALQHLGNVAFRTPVPAYKHSAAVFLHLQGKVPSPLTHPNSPRRPPWEAEILRDCAARLGFGVTFGQESV